MSQITAILRRCANSLMTMLFSPMRGSNFSLMGDYLRYSLFDGYKANCNYLKKDKKALLYFQVPNILQDVQGSKKKFELQLRSTLDSLKLEKKSDYGKVKAIYDYICDNVKYDNTHGPNYSQKIYSLCRTRK